MNKVVNQTRAYTAITTTVQGDTTNIVEPAAGSSSTTTTTTTTTPEVSESLLRTYVQNKFNKLVEEDSSVLNDIDNTTVNCE